MLRLVFGLGVSTDCAAGRHLTAAAAVAVAALLATPVAGAAGGDIGVRAGCVTVAVAADRPTSVLLADGFETGDLSMWSDPAPAFSATEILDVLFEVGLEIDDADVHLVELGVWTPNGHLFQTLTVPVSTAPGLAGSSVRVEGFPHPVAVRHATAHPEDGSGGSRVTVPLPVAGTQVVSHSIYGIWRVEAAVDGLPSTCPEQVRFVMVP